MSASTATMDDVVVLLNNWEPRLPIMQVTHSVQLLQCSLAALDTQCRLAHITAACRHSIISAFCSSLTLFYNPHFKLGWNENQENEFSATWKSLCSCMKLVLECPADTVPPKDLSISKVQAIQVLQRCSNGRLHEDGWDVECHAAPLLGVLTALLTSRPTSKSVFHACNGIQYLVRWLQRLAVMSFLIVTDDLKCSIIKLLATAIECDENGTEIALDSKAIPILLRFVANQADQVLFSILNFFEVAIHASFEKTRKQFLIADGVNVIIKLQSQTKCDELKLGLNDLLNVIKGEESLMFTAQRPDEMVVASIQQAIPTADHVEKESFFIDNHAKQNINLLTVSEADDKKSIMGCSNNKQSPEFDSVRSEGNSEFVSGSLGPNISEVNIYQEMGKCKDHLICSNSNECSDTGTQICSCSHTSIVPLSIKTGYCKKQIQLPKIIKPLKYRPRSFNSETNPRKINSIVHGKLNSVSGENVLKKVCGSNRSNIKNNNFNEETGNNSKTYTSSVHGSNNPRIDHQISHFESALLTSDVDDFDRSEKTNRCCTQNIHFVEETRKKTIDYTISAQENNSALSSATANVCHGSRLCGNVVCQNAPEYNKYLGDWIKKEGSSKQTSLYMGDNLHDSKHIEIHSSTPLKTSLKRDRDSCFHKFELENGFSINGRKQDEIHTSAPLKNRELEQLFHSGNVKVSQNSHYGSCSHTSSIPLSIKPGYWGEKPQLQKSEPLMQTIFERVNSSTKTRKMNSMVHGKLNSASDSNVDLSGESLMRKLCDNSGSLGNEQPARLLQLGKELGFQNRLQNGPAIAHLSYGYVKCCKNLKIARNNQLTSMKCQRSSSVGCFKNDKYEQNYTGSCTDANKSKSIIKTYLNVKRVKFEPKTMHAESTLVKITDLSNKILGFHAMKTIYSEPNQIVDKLSSDSEDGIPNGAKSSNQMRIPSNIYLSSDSDDGVPNGAKSINQMRIPSNIHLSNDSDDGLPNGAKSINQMRIPSNIHLSSDSDDGIPIGAKSINQMRVLSNIDLSSDDGIPNGAKIINSEFIAPIADLSSDSDDVIPKVAKGRNQTSFPSHIHLRRDNVIPNRNAQSIQYSLK